MERSDAILVETSSPAPVLLEEALSRLRTEDAAPPVGPAEAVAFLTAAEAALAEGSTSAETWHKYLDLTRRREYLMSLPDPDQRTRWAETAFGALRASNYSLATLLSQRVAAHPDRVFLQGSPRTEAPRWTYAQTARRLRTVAAALASAAEASPRVAIVAENSLDAACCDLACLVHGIFVAPVAPHLSTAELTLLLEQLGANLAVVETAETLAKIESVSARLSHPIRPVLLDPAARLKRGSAAVLGEEAGKLGADDTDRILRAIPGFGLDETATVLFTSGSTGAQKGVAFSPFNLLTKRFARAAALPFVGEGETLLCYLPLYHTFGRYLELLGALFWGGTYVFAGNPSLETLLSGLREVRPTGLVGIPARWQQLHERCLRRLSAVASLEEEAAAVREVTGGRLAWGLSAAGYLEPAVFRFFQRCGIAFCSGFGMTEATGGITMTPPDRYEEGTVGLPLPGIRVRLDETGELLVAGPYVARDLGDSSPTEGGEYWLRTGDIFRVRPSGFLEIVDRVKDIYKNSRGQTVAPRRVEQLFEGVPGIKRTFLAGDGREDNVLLIVPDAEAPLLGQLESDEERQDYFKRIVAGANMDLAPHERVVGFAVLGRDFALESGELTPKGSYRRKAVEENFREVLASLYRGTAVRLLGKDLEVRVPRWLHRDIGILEGDLVLREGALEDTRRGLSLTLRRMAGGGAVRVGDLEYALQGDTLDLGLLAHQPLLWLGNPSLAAFCPLKPGWDLPLGAFSPRVRLPADGLQGAGPATGAGIASPELATIHQAICEALFGGSEESLQAVGELEERLRRADAMTAMALRRRLEALAYHPAVAVRCAAFRILLVDDPAPGVASEMESFLESGLSFLTAESIERIAMAGLPGERLSLLRRRLHAYRARLVWPLPPEQASLLSNVFSLLVRHATSSREDYVAVRSELARWALEEADPSLARTAAALLDQLSAWYQEGLPPPASYRKKLAFHEGLNPSEQRRLEQLFDETGFLEESLALACSETVAPEDIGPAGIWIAPVATVRRHQLYRAGINTRSNRHHDLLLIVGDDLDLETVHQTKLWMEALASPGDREPVVPAFGCFRPEIGALSVGWVDEPTLAMRLWELEKPAPEGGAVRWRTLFVRALAAFFASWEASGRRLVPGAVSPANVVVPREDFREGTVLLSLAGHRRYEGPLSLVGAMVRNFFEETSALYPRSRSVLQLSWIADACVEALGLDGARAFLDELLATLRDSGESEESSGRTLLEQLEAARAGLDSAFHAPLALLCAIDRFEAWEALEPGAPLSAREAMARGLEKVYRLQRFPEIVRYDLHRRTTFARAALLAQHAYDTLLFAMFHRPAVWPTEMVELADTQAALETAEERLAFGRLVFPGAAPSHDVALAAVGEGARHLVAMTHVTDRNGAHFTVRDPLDPAELGRLVQLLLRSGVPRAYSEGRRLLVALDDREHVVAGVAYSILEGSVAQLDGVAVTAALRGHGLLSAILDDLCARLRGFGIEVLTTHLAYRDVPLGHAFRYDPRWRCLVRQCAVEDEGGRTEV